MFVLGQVVGRKGRCFLVVVHIEAGWHCNVLQISLKLLWWVVYCRWLIETFFNEFESPIYTVLKLNPEICVSIRSSFDHCFLFFLDVFYVLTRTYKDYTKNENDGAGRVESHEEYIFILEAYHDDDVDEE